MSKDFADRIREALALRRMSQAELVRLTGLSSSAVSQYASGKFIPKQQALIQLARALNVSPSWLLGAPVGVNGELTPEYRSRFRRIPILKSVESHESITQEKAKVDEVVVMISDPIDFAIRVPTDDMISARIYPGDLALIQQRDTCEEDCICLLRVGDGPLRIVRLIKESSVVVLFPSSPRKKREIFSTKAEKDSIQIFGIVKKICFEVV